MNCLVISKLFLLDPSQQNLVSLTLVIVVMIKELKDKSQVSQGKKGQTVFSFLFNFTFRLKLSLKN